MADPFIDLRPLDASTPPATTPPGTLLSRIRKSTRVIFGREIVAEQFGPEADHGLVFYGVCVWSLLIGVVVHRERLPAPSEDDDHDR